MTRLLICLIAILLSAGPWWRITVKAATWSIVQTKSDAGDDVAIDFASAPSALNCIVTFAVMANITQTMQITNFTPAEVQLSLTTSGTYRAYLWVMAGDGADDVYTVETVAGATAHAFAMEVSGLTCDSMALDDEVQEDVASSDPWTLGTDLDLATAGALVLSAATVATGGFSRDLSGDTSSGTLIEDATSIAMAQYEEAVSAGAKDVTFDWEASEAGRIYAYGIKGTAVAGPPVGSLSTLGVGR